MNKNFTRDRRIFDPPVDQYIKDHYALLIKFIEEDLVNVELKNEYGDLHTLLSTLISIFISSLPFILNLSWVTNVAVIIVTCLNAVISNTSTYLIYRNITSINLILAAVLIVHHFITSSALIMNEFGKHTSLEHQINREKEQTIASS
jgi:intracellular septation protein A